MTTELGMTLWIVWGVGLVLLTLPGTIELILVTWGGVWAYFRRRSLRGEEDPTSLRIAIVIPAHNEELLIQRCIRGLLACDLVEPEGIIVVADNCTDATAERARAAGARVLVRQDPRRRGKGQALAFAFARLQTEQSGRAPSWDAYAVIDADTVVEPNFLRECRRLFAAGADAVQARYLVRNADDSWRTRFMRVSFLAFNVLRPRGRAWWGFSAGILGNGFALTRDTLRAVPYDAHSIVEDLEYHIRLASTGRRVAFADATTVWADMPVSKSAVATQRARWEGGRWRVLRDSGWLLLRAILAGQYALIEPLLDLLLLPLAFHCALLLLTAVSSMSFVQWFAFAGLGVVLLHVSVTLLTCGGTWKDVCLLGVAPFYMMWKLSLLPALVRAARPEAAWVRTAREVAPATPSGQKASPASTRTACDASIVIVSFNTRELLRECLTTVQREAGSVSYEVIVVDNASHDGSADMVAQAFPWARLVRSAANLGFAAANNAAFPLAQGRYVVLLNSDAFLRPEALARAVARMDADPRVGLAGARLVGRDDSWQPSARQFPSPLNDFLALSGLAARFPHSRFFGRMDRTWANPLQPAEVDWAPGAFSIVRRSVLEQVGYFDERFFLYYEEVDFCRRIRAAGYTVWYWPDVVVVHLGGESSRTIPQLALSPVGSQLTLWRMRSAFLYYYKHHGVLGAWSARQLESLWHGLRTFRNALSAAAERQGKVEESNAIQALLRQAWRDTRGGRLSPERPW
jgi:GT2 family glycosyltransferase